MSNVQLIDSLVLTHEEVLVVWSALQAARMSLNFSEHLVNVIASHDAVKMHGEQGMESLFDKIRNYHAALHIADPSLDEHNDN